MNKINSGKKKHIWHFELLIELGRFYVYFMKEFVLPGTNITIELEKTNHTDLYGKTLA